MLSHEESGTIEPHSSNTIVCCGIVRQFPLAA
jgi:hypothetical protein